MRHAPAAGRGPHLHEMGLAGFDSRSARYHHQHVKVGPSVRRQPHL